MHTAKVTATKPDPSGFVGMKKAIWNGQVLAESDEFVVVENNHYFPPESVNKEFLKPSDTTTYCGWKGDCQYHHVVVNGIENKDAAWYYADPYSKAENIRGHIAFWKGVVVKDA